MSKTSLTRVPVKTLHFLVLISLGLLMLCSRSASAQTPIPCGQLTAGSIATSGQVTRYTFTATAGDAATFRVVTTTNNFTPQMQILFGSQVLATSSTAITGTLAQTGTYTVAVSSSFSGGTGAYALMWQRTKNACNAIQLGVCQTLKGNVRSPADLDAYVFNGAAGQTVLLQLRALTTNLNISWELELYDPDGLLVTSSTSGVISGALTKTGPHTVLVTTDLFEGMAGNYTLTLGNLAMRLSTPNGGETLLAGTTVPIKWSSSANSPSISAHELLLSTDGGVSFPTQIVSGLSSSTQSYDWHISPALTTNNARIRVVAKDSLGGFCQDESDASFTVAGLASTTPVSYKYDELSRLTQAVYDDGTGITYTYDATGNRLTEVVAPVPFYNVTCNPAAVNGIAAGVATTCSVRSLNGFTSSVSVTCADGPPGLSCSSNPATVTPPANGSVNSTVTVAVNSSVPPGTYSVLARGTGGGFARNFNLRVTVPVPALQLSASSFVVAESAGSVQIAVNRTGSSASSATLDYAASSGGTQDCNVVNGTASSRCDYLSTLGTLRFAGNETSKIISIPIVDDSYAEGNETFTITLSNPTGATLGASTATVTITDNDSANGANPFTQAGFFVRQHYIDFLNRQPDASGLAFWTDQINSCGTDQACVEVRRINVSAAFFLSIEFQETGYLVYRMYKAAYGNLPGAPVPIKLSEFLPDTQQIGQGVVVNVGNWQTQLENNKVAFATDFVTRSRFVAAYPTTMTPTALVDALFSKTGVTPSAVERTSIINEFGSDVTTADAAARARVLRRIAENSNLKQQETNKAFVLMQYFGYLRRNPNDAPEAGLNFDGYNFWLTKLNQFNGNFVNAEMVKAFILSGEYRQRFGP